MGFSSIPDNGQLVLARVARSYLGDDLGYRRLVGAAVVLVALLAVWVPAADPFALMADSLVHALTNGDSTFLDEHADPLLFDDIMAHGAALPSSARAHLAAVTDAMRRLGTVVLRDIGSTEAVFTPVRWEEVSKNQRTLLMRIHGERLLVYVRVHLTSRNGRIYVSDWRNLATGVSVRESLRFWLETLRAESGNPNQASLSRFLTSLRECDVQRASQEFKRLPRSIAENPVVVAARISAARTCGGESISDVLGWLETRRRRARKYPFLLVDYYISQNESRLALDALRDMERLVGPEAGLDCLRAVILGASGRTADAYGAFAGAIRRDPSFEPAYWRLLDLLVAQRKFADATLVLDILAVKFGHTFTFDQFAEIETYRDFVRSAEFREWIREWDEE